MSLSTIWSQHKSTLIGILCFATVLGALATFRTRPTRTPLRRSGAVHRGRTGPGVIKLLPPNAAAPLGQLCLWRNGQVVVNCNIATDQLPAAEGYLHFLAESELVDVRTLVLARVVESCTTAFTSGEYRHELEALGLGELIQDLRDLRGGLREDAISALHRIPMLRNVEDLPPTGLNLDYVPVNTGVPLMPDFDDRTTEVTEAEIADITAPENKDENQDRQLRTLLYRIAGEEAKREAYDHRGFRCDQCNVSIKGIRWHCLQCYDYDLCSTCETTTRHEKTHVFAKVKIPTTASFKHHFQPLENWYTGDPSKAAYTSLDQEQRQAMAKEHARSEEQIDALFDQFCCLVNADWEDGSGVMKFAMDRVGFNKALHFEHWRDRASAERMYSQMFAFYDTDGNGLIGFEEFVSGLSYLRGAHRFKPLTRAIQGFDVDNDGFVSRNDFLQLLRAQFLLQSEEIRHLVTGQDMRLLGDDPPFPELASSQPISSMLREEGVPMGGPRAIRGKVPDPHGDLQPQAKTKTILDEDDPWLEGHATVLSDRDSGELEVSDAFHEMLHRVGSSSCNLQKAPMDQPPLEKSGDESAELRNALVLWEVLEESLGELLNELFEGNESRDRRALQDATKLQGIRGQVEVAACADNALFEGLTRAGSDAQDRFPESVAKGNLSSGSNDVLKSGPEPPPESTGSPDEKESLSVASSTHLSAGREESAPLETSDRPGHPNNGLQALFDAAYCQKGGPADVAWLLELPEVDVLNGVGDEAVNEMSAEVTADLNAPTLSKRGLLQHVAQVQKQLKEIQARGGAGKLSLQEVAEKADERDAIRGFVKAWLDWASF